VGSEAEVLTFLAAALILIMIPGPDQALITRHALTSGRTAGLFTMLGGATGLTVHATAAAAGVSAILVASETAFTMLKVVGVIYLMWMGVQTIRAASGQMVQDENAESRPAYSPWHYLRHGFLSNSLNPKVALFFVTFLPQFLPDSGGAFMYALFLSGLFAALYVVWFSCSVFAIEYFATFLRRPRVRARIERVTGLLLVGFALRLAFQQAG
jgi:threonine/homoserine/homoserine lactone efflux protein